MAAAILTQETLKSLLHYDAETGIFTRLVSTNPRAQAGTIAGTPDTKGYLRIQIDGKRYLVHRLAWIYTYGSFPSNQLDHINRVRTDNRICNLRLATNAENCQNLSIRRDNKSGHRGVHWDTAKNKWHSAITQNNKLIYLGRFTDLSDAIAARKAAELKFHTFQNS